MDYPAVILNIGGVANMTYLRDAHSAPLACDTGPGGALIDDFMLERTGTAMDKDGKAAAAGHVHETILQRLLTHPYFSLPPPKSLDRHAFDRHAVSSLSLEDGAATLTAFTAHAIARILPFMPEPAKTVVVAGGGAANPTLMTYLSQALGCNIVAASAMGWSPDALEAQAFAYLAVRSLLGLPLSFPTTTGVKEACCGGVLARPKGD